MPKMKTNKSVAKRFSRTGSGKITHARAYRRHILTKKSADQKRRLRRDPAVVVGADAKRILRMAPYL
ncbi:50S ribosomal protein L35 [Candidatus Persebacteraceae bacterium Df01]|jgi:large subunit ribosomal protein L35|uniref:Large ribosomal subunit protein bL35 n=1 Tax=Candidatus Doriopsillibacter californiensis TaxID=2970740 RepID=A0ABT7QLA2_9GAMM|nr:50S ribosomal protein L35 [Candidatus Persebacteraceae bacterium Df01]